MPALPGIKVEHVAVHEIFKQRAGETVEPLLTDRLVALTPELEAFFAKRLVETMQSAFGVQFEPDTESEVPALITGLVADHGKLMEVSRRLASTLQGAQPAISPPGLLVVLTGRTTDHTVAAVMKLEHETGVRSQLVEGRDGTKVFEITLEHDLFLTDNTKVFKAAVFRLPPEPNATSAAAPADVDVWMSDDQAGVGAAPVARFFREEFLACIYRLAPEIQTQEFHTAAERFVNGVTDAEKRVRYGNALMTELLSSRQQVTPRTFARENLDVDDQQRFLTTIQQAGVGSARFPKDVSRIRTKLRRTTIRTQSGAEVVARPELFDEGIVTVVSADEEGPDRIEIRDKIKNVHGR